MTVPQCSTMPDNSIIVDYQGTEIHPGDTVDVYMKFSNAPVQYGTLHDNITRQEIDHTILDKNGCGVIHFTPQEAATYQLQGVAYLSYSNLINVNVIRPHLPPPAVIPSEIPPAIVNNPTPANYDTMPQTPGTPSGQVPPSEGSGGDGSGGTLKYGIINSKTTLDGYIYAGHAVQEVIDIDFIKFITSSDDIQKIINQKIPDKIYEMGKQNGYKVLKTQIEYKEGLVWDTLELTVWHVPPQTKTSSLQAMQFELIPIWEILQPLLPYILGVIAAFLVYVTVVATKEMTWTGLLFTGVVGVSAVAIVLSLKDRTLRSLY